jgi:hypothetical protein
MAAQEREHTMAGPKEPLSSKLPPGTSLNESLEPRTLLARFPNADPTNKGQKAVDFTEGTKRTIREVQNLRTKIWTVEEIRTRGKWVQNKLLDPVKEDSGTADAGELLRRVNANVKLAMEKLEFQLKMPKAITRDSSDGSKYSLDLRDPESFLIHLEIPGIEKHPKLKASLEAAANDLASRYEYDKQGLSVQAKISEPPPEGTVGLPAEPVSDLTLSPKEFEVKYRVATDEPATRVRVGAGEPTTEIHVATDEPAAKIRVAIDEPATKIRVATGELTTKVRVAEGESFPGAGAPTGVGSRVSSGLQTVGALGAGIGASLVSQWLGQKISEKLAELESKRIEPEIQSTLDALGPQVAELQLSNPGAKIYAHVSITTETGTALDPGPGPGIEFGGPQNEPLPPHMKVDSITIDTKYEEQSSVHKHEHPTWPDITSSYDYDTLSYSVELRPYTKEELILYLRNQIAKEEGEAGRTSSTSKDAVASQQRRDQLTEKLRKLLAPDEPNSSQTRDEKDDASDYPLPPPVQDVQGVPQEGESHAPTGILERLEEKWRKRRAGSGIAAQGARQAALLANQAAQRAAQQAAARAAHAAANATRQAAAAAELARSRLPRAFTPPHPPILPRQFAPPPTPPPPILPRQFAPPPPPAPPILPRQSAPPSPPPPQSRPHLAWPTPGPPSPHPHLAWPAAAPPPNSRVPFYVSGPPTYVSNSPSAPLPVYKPVAPQVIRPVLPVFRPSVPVIFHR